MDGVSAKEFGKMQGDIDHIKRDLDRHTLLLERVDSKLDNLVTHKQLDARLLPIEREVKLLKDAESARSGRLLDKVSAQTENIIVIAIAGALVLLLINATAERLNGQAQTQKIDAVIKKEKSDG